MLSKRGVAGGILVLWVIIVGLGIPGAAFSQTVNGGIHGTVTDGTGAAIPEASVKVTNLATGLVRVASANSSGWYTITELPPGQYSVTVSKPAFATVVQEHVELLVNQDLEVDYTLRVGVFLLQAVIYMGNGSRSSGPPPFRVFLTWRFILSSSVLMVSMQNRVRPAIAPKKRT